MSLGIARLASPTIPDTRYNLQQAKRRPRGGGECSHPADSRPRRKSRCSAKKSGPAKSSAPNRCRALHCTECPVKCQCVGNCAHRSPGPILCDRHRDYPQIYSTVLANFIATEARKLDVDPPQKRLSLPLGTKEARIRPQDPTAADRDFFICLLGTRGDRRTSRVRLELQVNMRESERERLARRDAYEREMERRAKKRKRA